MLRILSLALVWLFSAAAIVEDGFLEAYKRGRNAADDKKWAAVEVLMRQAIEGRAEESRRLIGKGYMKRYVPHYFLGLALFEQGDCEGATQAWNESERQGVVAGNAEFYDNLLVSRESCDPQAGIGSRFDSLASALQELTGSLVEADAAVDDAKVAAVWNSGNPSLASSVADLEDRIRGTLELLRASRMEGDEEAADQIEARVSAIRGDLRVLEGRIQQARTGPPAPSRQGRARERTPSAGATAPRAAPEPPPEPPPETLQMALSAYVEGRHEDVLMMLDAYAPVSEEAAFHVHLLRAASSFATSLVSEDQSEDLEAAAAAEVMAAFAVRPEAEVSERFFSPRFRRFVADVTAEPVGEN